jgi:hypothetical protein
MKSPTMSRVAKESEEAPISAKKKSRPASPAKRITAPLVKPKPKEKAKEKDEEEEEEEEEEEGEEVVERKDSTPAKEKSAAAASSSKARARSRLASRTPSTSGSVVGSPSRGFSRKRRTTSTGTPDVTNKELCAIALMEEEEKRKKRKREAGEEEQEEGDDAESTASRASKKQKKAAAPAKSPAKSKAASKKAAAAAAEDEEEEEDEEEDETAEYEIDRIVSVKRARGRGASGLLFEVRWRGYTAADDTWESEANISDTAAYLKYKADHPEAFQKPVKAAATKQTKGKGGKKMTKQISSNKDSPIDLSSDAEEEEEEQEEEEEEEEAAPVAARGRGRPPQKAWTAAVAASKKAASSSSSKKPITAPATGAAAAAGSDDGQLAPLFSSIFNRSALNAPRPKHIPESLAVLRMTADKRLEWIDAREVTRAYERDGCVITSSGEDQSNDSGGRWRERR